MKEQIIQIPDTLKVKEIKDGMIILVEKEKKLTYEDIAKELFPDNEIHYYITDGGDIFDSHNNETTRNCKNNATSKRQLEKLLAINMLMNVAKYLNDGWKPDFSNMDEYKYHILIEEDKIIVKFIQRFVCLDIYFKSKELARKAIEILGEETIRLALCTNY